MSLPVSWLSAVLPHSLSLARATVHSLSASAAAFGAELDPKIPLPSGPSGSRSGQENSSPNRSTNAERLDRNADRATELRSRLARFVAEIRRSLGISDPSAPVELLADGVGIPRVVGDDATSRALQSQLQSQPELVSELNDLVREERDRNPLRWLPGGDAAMRLRVD